MRKTLNFQQYKLTIFHHFSSEGIHFKESADIIALEKFNKRIPHFVFCDMKNQYNNARTPRLVPREEPGRAPAPAGRTRPESNRRCVRVLQAPPHHVSDVPCLHQLLTVYTLLSLSTNVQVETLIREINLEN